MAGGRELWVNRCVTWTQGRGSLWFDIQYNLHRIVPFVLRICLIWQGEAVELWLSARYDDDNPPSKFFSVWTFRRLPESCFSWWISSHLVLEGAKVLFLSIKSVFFLFIYLFFSLISAPTGPLRRCGNQTCPSRCGLSSWMRAYCGTGPAGCGNSAQWAGPGIWTAAARTRRRPSAPASGTKAHDGRRPTRTTCCWRGPQPSWAHPCLIVSAPALWRLLKDFGGEDGLSRQTCCYQGSSGTVSASSSPFR